MPSNDPGPPSTKQYLKEYELADLCLTWLHIFSHLGSSLTRATCHFLLLPLQSNQKKPWILRVVIFQGCHTPERSTPPPFWIHFPTKELQLPLRQACFLQSIKRKHILDIQNYSKGTLSFQFLRLFAPVWYDIGASPNWIYGGSHYANGLRPHETCNAAITIYPNGPQGRLVSHLEISKKSWRSTKFWCFLFWTKRKFLWTFLCNF